jgi:hypothetical protein
MKSALILFTVLMAGCSTIPPGAVRQAIDERWPRVEAQECPVINVIVCNGVQDEA